LTYAIPLPDLARWRCALSQPAAGARHDARIAPGAYLAQQCLVTRGSIRYRQISSQRRPAYSAAGVPAGASMRAGALRAWGQRPQIRTAVTRRIVAVKRHRRLVAPLAPAAQSPEGGPRPDESTPRCRGLSGSYRCAAILAPGAYWGPASLIVRVEPPPRHPGARLRGGCGTAFSQQSPTSREVTKEEGAGGGPD
jgi:hypothetical protein